MKLYTEEQVIEMTKAAFTAGQNHNSFIFGEEFKKVTPIELPSDEEIIEVSKNKSAWEYNHESNFRLGAAWMREKILKQQL